VSAYTYAPHHTLSEVLAGACALGWTVVVDGHVRELIAPSGRGWRCQWLSQQWAALRAGGVIPPDVPAGSWAGEAEDAEAAYRAHRGMVVSETVVAETFAGTEVDFDDTTPDGVLSDAGRRQALGGGAA
jgi:hypothetical protein